MRKIPIILSAIGILGICISTYTSYIQRAASQKEEARSRYEKEKLQRNLQRELEETDFQLHSETIGIYNQLFSLVHTDLPCVAHSESDSGEYFWIRTNERKILNTRFFYSDVETLEETDEEEPDYGNPKYINGTSYIPASGKCFISTSDLDMGLSEITSSDNSHKYNIVFLKDEFLTNRPNCPSNNGIRIQEIDDSISIGASNNVVEEEVLSHIAELLGCSSQNELSDQSVEHQLLERLNYNSFFYKQNYYIATRLSDNKSLILLAQEKFSSDFHHITSINDRVYSRESFLSTAVDALNNQNERRTLSASQASIQPNGADRTVSPVESHIFFRSRSLLIVSLMLLGASIALLAVDFRLRSRNEVKNQNQKDKAKAVELLKKGLLRLSSKDIFSTRSPLIISSIVFLVLGLFYWFAYENQLKERREKEVTIASDKLIEFIQDKTSEEEASSLKLFELEDFIHEFTRTSGLKEKNFHVVIITNEFIQQARYTETFIDSEEIHSDNRWIYSQIDAPKRYISNDIKNHVELKIAEKSSSPLFLESFSHHFSIFTVAEVDMGEWYSDVKLEGPERPEHKVYLLTNNWQLISSRTLFLISIFLLSPYVVLLAIKSTFWLRTFLENILDFLRFILFDETHGLLPAQTVENIEQQRDDIARDIIKITGVARNIDVQSHSYTSGSSSGSSFHGSGSSSGSSSTEYKYYLNFRIEISNEDGGLVYQGIRIESKRPFSNLQDGDRVLVGFLDNQPIGIYNLTASICIHCEKFCINNL